MPPTLHTWLRTAGYRLRPPNPLPFEPAGSRRASALLGRGLALPRQAARILWERRGGRQPTIVLGGFVPDATEQVFLLRGPLLRQGSVYYLNYPREGFSLDLLCAQLDDLVEAIAAEGERPPVVLGVSFGAGIILEWLRRRRDQIAPAVAGCILVSPVALVSDLVPADGGKPRTLLGRALRPCLAADPSGGAASIEKSRGIFAKMFEAGAQNRAALRALLTPTELKQLHARVLDAIRGTGAVGAVERIRALQAMAPLGPESAPLTEAPALILYAENEEAVLDPGSPTRTALESRPHRFFPAGECRVVLGQRSPAQHASLIFHYFEFLAPIAAFYQRLKEARLRLAA